MAAGFKDFSDRAKALPVNSAIAEKYVSYLENRQTPNEQSRLGYLGMVMIFLESLNKEITQLKIFDIEGYKRNRQTSDNRFNDALSRIADFFEYCVHEGFNVKLSKNDILNIKIPKSAIKEDNAPKALSPQEIVDIRRALIEKDDVRKLLTFELLYGFGLKERDLKYFNFENYNINSGGFIYEGKTYILPLYLQTVIEKASDKALDKYSTYGGKEIGTFKNHVVVAGELCGIKLKISDLTKTFEETSIVCPSCKNKYPFEDQYWMLKEFRAEDYQFYFPICYGCAKGKERV